MIIINKKRLILITSMVCISLSVFMFKNTITENPAIETVTLPVSNKVIVIDAGHGVPDERCRK